MNVRVIPSGSEPAEPAPAGEWPAGRAAVVPAPDEPISIGDRVRGMMTSDNDKAPLYPRLLRLRHVHPNGWQRAVLIEGMALLGALAALADQATAWAPVILPVAAAVVVKFHDVLAGVLPQRTRRAQPGGPPSGNASAASPTRGNAAETDGR